MSYLFNFTLWMFGKFLVLMPRSFHLLISNIMGVIWFDLLRLRRKIVIENIGIAFPGWDLDKKISVGRKSVQNLCLSILEYPLLYALNPEQIKNYYIIKNTDFLNAEYAKKSGVLMLGLHLGSIDLALSCFAHAGYKVNVTSKLINNHLINQFFFSVREKYGVRSIMDRRNPYKIFKTLRSGEVVLFVMDQFLGKPHGIPVTFFDKRSWTAPGLAAFSIKTRHPVIPIYNYREKGKIIIDLQEPIYLDLTEDHEENIRRMTQKYNNALEKIIKCYPEQWLWLHRRWKDY